jgi:hypothetical protein
MCGRRLAVKHYVWHGDDCGRVVSCVWPVGAAICTAAGPDVIREAGPNYLPGIDTRDPRWPTSTTDRSTSCDRSTAPRCLVRRRHLLSIDTVHLEVCCTPTYLSQLLRCGNGRPWVIFTLGIYVSFRSNPAVGRVSDGSSVPKDEIATAIARCAGCLADSVPIGERINRGEAREPRSRPLRWQRP